MDKKTISKYYYMILAALFLALAMILPFLTGQIPKIGNSLCPMHIPVLLCGFICGPVYGLIVGFIAPIFRSVIFGVPPMIPKGISMAFELAAYGSVSGILYRILPRKKSSIYIALITAMLIGRVVWGICRTLFFGLGGYDFGWAAFISGAFITAVPGIIIQLIVIPVMVMLYGKNQS